MKAIMYLIMAIFTIICSGQKAATSKNNSKQEYNIPTVTNRFETFDFETFGKRTSKSRYDEEKEDTLRILTSAAIGYSEGIYFKNSYFSITKNFYPNGNIEMKGVTFNNGSVYGIWYEFSEDGKLIKETNHNQPKYKIGWNYILSYCKEHDIPLTKGYIEPLSGFHTEIYFDKDVEKEHGIWTITYQVAGDGNKLVEIKLHGNSGYEISKKELELIGP